MIPIRGRRIGLMVGVALIASVTVPAQEIGLSLGTQGGVNLGAYTGSHWNELIADMDSAEGDAIAVGNLWGLGFTVSSFLQIGLTSHLAVQPQLGIAMRRGGFAEAGYVHDPASGSHTEISTQSVDSYAMLDLPIYLKPRAEAGILSFHALFGPHFAIVLGRGYSAQLEDGEEVPDDSGSFTVDNRFLVGVGGGTGMGVDLGVGSVVLDLTAFRSFNSPFDNIEGTDTEIEGPRILSVAVSAGFAVPLDVDL